MLSYLFERSKYLIKRHTNGIGILEALFRILFNQRLEKEDKELPRITNFTRLRWRKEERIQDKKKAKREI